MFRSLWSRTSSKKKSAAAVPEVKPEEKATESATVFQSAHNAQLSETKQVVAFSSTELVSTPKATATKDTEAGIMTPEVDVWTDQEQYQYVVSLGVAENEFEDYILRFLTDSLKTAPLPTPWAVHRDQVGRVFFANVTTGQTTWKHPLETALRQLAGTCRVCISLAPALRQPCIANLKENWEAAAKHEFSLWYGVVHEESGREYYCNVETNEVMWEHPTLVVLPSLYMKLRSVERLLDDDYVQQLKMISANTSKGSAFWVHQSTGSTLLPAGASSAQATSGNWSAETDSIKAELARTASQLEAERLRAEQVQSELRILTERQRQVEQRAEDAKLSNSQLQVRLKQLEEEKQQQEEKLSFTELQLSELQSRPQTSYTLLPTEATSGCETIPEDFQLKLEHLKTQLEAEQGISRKATLARQKSDLEANRARAEEALLASQLKAQLAEAEKVKAAKEAADSEAQRARAEEALLASELRAHLAEAEQAKAAKDAAELEMKRAQAEQALLAVQLKAERAEAEKAHADKEAATSEAKKAREEEAEMAAQLKAILEKVAEAECVKADADVNAEFARNDQAAMVFELQAQLEELKKALETQEITSHAADAAQIEEAQLALELAARIAEIQQVKAEKDAAHAEAARARADQAAIASELEEQRIEAAKAKSVLRELEDSYDVVKKSAEDASNRHLQTQEELEEVKRELFELQSRPTSPVQLKGFELFEQTMFAAPDHDLRKQLERAERELESERRSAAQARNLCEQLTVRQLESFKSSEVAQASLQEAKLRFAAVEKELEALRSSSLSRPIQLSTLAIGDPDALSVVDFSATGGTGNISSPKAEVSDYVRRWEQAIAETKQAEEAEDVAEALVKELESTLTSKQFIHAYSDNEAVATLNKELALQEEQRKSLVEKQLELEAFEKQMRRDLQSTMQALIAERTQREELLKSEEAQRAKLEEEQERGKQAQKECQELTRQYQEALERASQAEQARAFAEERLSQLRMSPRQPSIAASVVPPPPPPPLALAANRVIPPPSATANMMQSTMKGNFGLQARRKNFDKLTEQERRVAAANLVRRILHLRAESEITCHQTGYMQAFAAETLGASKVAVFSKLAASKETLLGFHKVLRDEVDELGLQSSA